VEGLYVGLEAVDNDLWDVYFGPLRLEDQPELAGELVLTAPRSPRGSRRRPIDRRRGRGAPGRNLRGAGLPAGHRPQSVRPSAKSLAGVNGERGILRANSSDTAEKPFRPGRSGPACFQSPGSPTGSIASRAGEHPLCPPPSHLHHAACPASQTTHPKTESAAASGATTRSCLTFSRLPEK
jgi:hypothetical protein